MDQTVILTISGVSGRFFVIARYCDARRTWIGYTHHFEPAALDTHELQETIDARMQRVTGERHYPTAAAAIGDAVTMLLQDHVLYSMPEWRLS